ncbi:MAG: hypothetical protein WCT37_03620 [Patescibacteria group bacterium]|jgi:hypothetical protein
MKKKTWYALLIIIALIIMVIAVSWLIKNNPDEPIAINGLAANNPGDQTNLAADDHNYPPSTTKTGDADSQGVVGTLGNQKCMEKFRIERNVTIPADQLTQSNLEVASLETFGSGAFYGKIKKYSPDNNYQLTELIDRLMQEQKISTYEHLWADICLYNRDFLNPDGGGSLNYYVEHYYCTNHCQTGSYGLNVNLNPDGSFVGYRTSFKW